MARLLVSLVIVASCLMAGIVRAEQASAEAVIESISYEKDEQNHEKIVFKLNGAHIPKIFAIKGERPRLVFDFIDTRYSDLINRITDTKGNLIKGVRVGIHDDPPKTRVVVDLKPEEQFQFEQDFLIEDNILSITFYPSEKKSLRQRPESAAVSVVPPSEQKTAGQPEVVPEQPAAAPLPMQQGVEKPVVPETAPAVANVLPPPQPTDQADSEKTELNSLLAAGVQQKPEPTVDPILREVSFERAADGNEMVLFKLNDFYPPIVFGIEKGNPRVVCDFLDTKLDKTIRSVIDTHGNFVNRIRVARHDKPDKVRVVLDLVPNRNYDLQQVFFKDDNLFVIVVNDFVNEPASTPPTVDMDSVR